MTGYYTILAVLSVLIIVCVAGMMGCFVVWRSIEYFGDALSHALMIGASLALFTDINQMLVMTVMALLIAGVVVYFTSRMHRESLVVSILSNGLMASSIVVVFFFKGDGFEAFEDFLLGDVRNLGTIEFLIVLAMALLVVGMFFLRRQEWLLLATNSDLASVDLVHKKRLDIEYYMLLALLIAITIKVAGILLVTSVLIMPPAIARIYAKNTSMMIIASVLISATAAALGLLAEAKLGTPFAAVTIAIEFVSFITMVLYSKKNNRAQLT